MKCLFLSLMLFAVLSISYGQGMQPDTLNHFNQSIKDDTNYIKLLLDSAELYSFSSQNTGLLLSEKALDLSRKIRFTKGETDALNFLGEAYHFQGNYPKALEIQFEALQINRKVNDFEGEFETLGYIGIVYNELGEYRQALQFLFLAKKIFPLLANQDLSFILANIGDAYDQMKMPDSAIFYQRQAYKEFLNHTSDMHLKSFILRHMGNTYSRTGEKDSAIKFYNDAILNSLSTNDKLNISYTQKDLAELYKSQHKYDSAFYYARQAYANAQSVHAKFLMLQASTFLSGLYRETQNEDSAYYYLEIASVMKDSLYGPEKIRQLQVLLLKEQQSQQIIIQQQQELRSKVKYILLLFTLGFFLLLAFILLRSNRHKQKANIVLKDQKEKVESILSELRSTQAQLIQSEKMASLGVLTAGIAHEIQNPLNFVNNFSEVSNELIDEMNIELDKGDVNEAKEIAADIKQNLEKINHHGKRAGDIVKGMLQHSQSSTGKKEPTDINALCDEYLRLSYHGLRAKDKSFNAEFKTDFDESIGKINIVPQDIGRVILNLINNAFYAVDEKKKSGLANYEPTVSINTKKLGDKIEIKVTDNGNGIPQNIIDKIFQPFFTTKPTGQGTGLGLSLSYDIVKANGGEIFAESRGKVKSKAGEGTTFIIQLPVV